MTGRVLSAAVIGAAALLCAGPAAAEQFTQKGLYSLNITGWRHASTPLGEVFACEDCGDAPVQVQISYGARLPGAEGASNDEFLDRLDSEDTQQQFADLMMQRSLPPGSELEYSIESMRKVRIGGLKAFEYVAVIQTQPNASREDAMVAVHHHRLMKLSLNFYDGQMSEEAAAKIGALLKSLKFF